MSISISVSAARRERRNRMQQRLRDQQMDGMVVSQNIDLYYFTGTMQTGYLMIPVEGNAVFYVRKSIPRAEQEADCAVKPLGSFRRFGDTLKRDFPALFEGGRRPKLAAELDVVPAQLFLRLQSAVPDAEWSDGSSWVRELRMIKSELEIECIRRAAAVADDALKAAFSKLKDGMAEYEWMALFEYELRKRGHLGIMRMRGYNQEIVTGMVASGPSAAVPTYFDGPAGGQGLSPASPQSSSRHRFGRNEPILIDIGCNIDGYVIDQTRTAVIGELQQELAKAYERTEQILKEIESMLKPGTPCEQLYERALQMAEDSGLAEHFMGFGTDQVRFLGHGIGLEIDEFPVLSPGFVYPLAEGMVIAIEPKFIFPDTGVVGIENTYAITQDGFERLTLSEEGLWKKE